MLLKKLLVGLPWRLSGREACQSRRHDPWSRKIPHAVEQLSLCTTAIEPVLQSPGATATAAQALEGPCSATREATAMRSLNTATREWPPLLQLKQSPRSNEDPTHPKHK